MGRLSKQFFRIIPVSPSEAWCNRMSPRLKRFKSSLGQTWPLSQLAFEFSHLYHGESYT